MTRARRRGQHAAQRALLGAATLLAGSFCARASAYHDVQRFSAGVDTGGGGGRFFTGSPADAYTCSVCHTGGTPVHLQIAGLPIDGYEPGKTYRISITWPVGLKAVSTNFEITDGAGRPFGQLSMPSRDDLSAPDLCLPVERGLPDLLVLPVEGTQRTVATVLACGAGRGTVDWTAPMPAADAESLRIGGTAHLSGSFASTDEDGTVAGDDVTDFSRAINPLPTAAPAGRKVTGDCNAASGAAPGAAPGFAWIGLMLLWFHRTRARAARAGSCSSNSDRSGRCSD